MKSNLASLVIASSFVTLFLAGCDKKADPAATTAVTSDTSVVKNDQPTATTDTKAGAATTPPVAQAPVATGPMASDAKPFLGLDLKPMGAWKPEWDNDAKVAKWTNDKYMSSIVNRVVTDKLDSVDDLKAAAPMMMQLGSAITGVTETKTTPKGWYAVVTGDGVGPDFVYVRKFGASTVVCSASLKPSMGQAIPKADAIKACESLNLKN